LGPAEEKHVATGVIAHFTLMVSMPDTEYGKRFAPRVGSVLSGGSQN
jgi:hypothetical protein